MKLRIIDTPGLADTRGIQQDGLHKNFAAQIEKHVNSITAVLVLANGTVPRGTGGMDCTLSTLLAILPNTLASRVAIMFTNTSSPLAWNISKDAIPAVFKDACQFRLDNPVALQKKYLKLMEDPNVNITATEMRDEVVTGEEKALEVLVELFDWLDGHEPPAENLEEVREETWKVKQISIAE